MRGRRKGRQEGRKVVAGREGRGKASNK